MWTRAIGSSAITSGATASASPSRPREGPGADRGDRSGDPILEPSSYRDRNGTVFYQGQEIYRAISAEALANWERLSAAPFFHEFVVRGSIVETERVAAPPLAEIGDGCAAVLRHARIPFVSHPYEWTFGMLKDAALLHLDLMLAALDEDLILKDASAYNVQWNGAEPVFIDTPSFEPLLEGEPWIGYRQFCELFLYPLMMQAYKGVDFRPWMRGRIDGIPASALRQLMSARDLMRPGVLMHVVTQDALQRRYSNGGGNVKGSLSEAGFNKGFISRNVRKLRKIIAGMVPAGAKGEWADYARTHSYEEEDFKQNTPSCRKSPAAAVGSWSGISDATPAPSPASPRSMRAMSWRWTATGWPSRSSTALRKAASTAAASFRSSSIWPTRRRARAGGAWSESPCPIAEGPTSLSASRSSTTW